MTLGTLNHRNYGIFLIMGDAGFSPSTVVVIVIAGVYQQALRELQVDCTVPLSHPSQPWHTHTN